MSEPTSRTSSSTVASNTAASRDPRALHGGRTRAPQRSFGAVLAGDKAQGHGSGPMGLGGGALGAHAHGAVVGQHGGHPGSAAVHGRRSGERQEGDEAAVDEAHQRDEEAESRVASDAWQAGDAQHDVRLDTFMRQLQELAPPVQLHRTSEPVAVAPTRSPAEDDKIAQLASSMLDGFALGTQNGRTVARMSVSQGRLAGAEVVLSHEGKRVHVEVNGASPADEAHLRERLGAALARKGAILE